MVEFEIYFEDKLIIFAQSYRYFYFSFNFENISICHTLYTHAEMPATYKQC